MYFFSEKKRILKLLTKNIFLKKKSFAANQQKITILLLGNLTFYFHGTMLQAGRKGAEAICNP